MTYRLLRADEWERVAQQISKYDAMVPDPTYATVAIAENESGEIEGFLIAQVAVHFDPLVLNNPNVNFIRLRDMLVSQLQPSVGGGGIVVYSFATSHKVAAMCERAGMKEMPYFVYGMEIKPLQEEAKVA